jgi:hypothetical protein
MSAADLGALSLTFLLSRWCSERRLLYWIHRDGWRCRIDFSGKLAKVVRWCAGVRVRSAEESRVRRVARKGKLTQRERNEGRSSSVTGLAKISRNFTTCKRDNNRDTRVSWSQRLHGGVMMRTSRSQDHDEESVRAVF